MKKQKIFGKLNFFAIGLGAFLAIAIFYVIQDPLMFQANILGIQDRNLIERQHWDLGYKVQDDVLDIYIPEIINFNRVVILIDYDITLLQIDLSPLEGQGNIVVDEISEGSVQITVTDLTKVNPQESLLLLPFQGPSHALVISEAQGFSDEEIQSLSVGRLDQDNEMIHRN